MSLSSHYASVLRTVDPAKVVSYMKAKGHLSVLPQVVRILERMPAKDAAVVRVSKKSDAETYKQEIQKALAAVSAEGGKRRLEIDPDVVGGYMIIGRGKVVDKTFRTALVSLYKNATRS